jgi:hypothetical protein
MEFNEIPQSILGASNQYEKDNSIQTLMPQCVLRDENWAIFEAYKSDKTRTIFYARKNKRADDSSWTWLCPSEAEVRTGFPKLCIFYVTVNQDNIRNRSVFKK